MDAQIILKRVIEIVSFVTKTDPQKINERTSYYGDLMIDSIDFQEIVFELEKAFGISISYDDMQEMNNYISDTVRVIKRLTD